MRCHLVKMCILAEHRKLNLLLQKLHASHTHTHTEARVRSQKERTGETLNVPT